jgi:hypothetical protein
MKWQRLPGRLPEQARYCGLRSESKAIAIRVWPSLKVAWHRGPVRARLPAIWREAAATTQPIPPCLSRLFPPPSLFFMRTRLPICTTTTDIKSFHRKRLRETVVCTTGGCGASASALPKRFGGRFSPLAHKRL